MIASACVLILLGRRFLVALKPVRDGSRGVLVAPDETASMPTVSGEKVRVTALTAAAAAAAASAAPAAPVAATQLPGSTTLVTSEASAGSAAASAAGPVGFARSVLRELIAPTIFVMSLGYSSIVSSAFTIFACTPESIAGVRYLVADLRIACNTPSYSALQAVAGLVIFGFGLGFPAFFAMVLWRRRASLAHPDTFRRLGFLYDGYKLENGLFLFECLTMVRKSLVVLLGSVVTDAYHQIACSIMLMAIESTLPGEPFLLTPGPT